MIRYFFLLFFIPASLVFGAQSPHSLYVTFDTQDPCHSMWVVWHSEREKDPLMLEEESGFKVIDSDSVSLKDSKLFVHSAKLCSLKEDTVYRFKLVGDQTLYSFKTMPTSLNRKVKVVIGGDVYRYLHMYRAVSQEIVHHDPDFVVVGGDIAYTKSNRTLFKGKDWEIKRWGTFFKEWFKNMRGQGGRLIPLVVVLGNHDIKDPAVDPFFPPFPYFKDLKAFANYNFGNYLSLFILDTGHATPVAGMQTVFLKEALQNVSKEAVKLAVYHIAAYPSVYSYDSRRPKEIRQEWVPLFEENNVKLCFENHNHAYKRTYPLKGGQKDKEGVIFIGDGAWGVEPRDPKEENRWYLEKAEALNCFTLVTLDKPSTALVESFGLEGESIDEPKEIIYMQPKALQPSPQEPGKNSQ